MVFKKIVLAAAVSVVASAALAENGSEKDFYVQLSAGPSFGQKPKGDFKKGDLDTSGLYGIAFGYKMNENFRADLSLDYRPGYESKYSEQEKASSGQNINLNHKVKVKSWTTMLNLYYDIATVNGFTPYVTSGLGVAKNKTNNYTISATGPNGFARQAVYNKGNKTNFAWKVGVGSKYQISQDFDLDLRYQYANLGKFETSSAFYGGGVKHNGVAKKGTIKAHEVLLGLAYKF